jgi:hypothetical protein
MEGNIEWKQIPNFPKYECSKMGNIRKFDIKMPINGSLHISGYYKTLFINKDDEIKNVSIHRLIAITWIPNPENKLTVNHINKIKTDNRVENLEWSTSSEQAIHRDLNIKKEIHTSNKIWMCDKKTLEKIKCFDTLIDAAIFIGDKNYMKNISACALNKIKSCYGYKWIYEEILDIENEIWTPLTYIGASNYLISNFGRVKNPYGRLNKPIINIYKIVSINSKNYYVHILVANVFIHINTDKNLIVNHKDGDKLNNIVDNLEFITKKDNTLHSIKNGLRKDIRRIVHYNSDNYIINIYNSATEAAKFLNTSHKVVLDICNGRWKSTKGLLVKFLEKSDDLINLKVNNPVICFPKIKNHSKQKSVLVYDRNDNLIDICKNIKEAGLKYNTHKTTVGNMCKKLTKYPKSKFIFKFKEYESFMLDK